jgi:hypothetical protein
MIFRNSLIVFLSLCAAAGAQVTEKQTCPERLAQLYPALVEYCDVSDKMPRDLYDLYREAYIEDPKTLFCADSLIGRGLGVDRLERATTFSVLGEKLRGDLLCCDEPRGGKLHVLTADGTVETRQVDLGAHYGNPSARPPMFDVPEDYLGKPSAMLGVYLQEVPGDRGPAIEVAAVIPGYARFDTWSGFLPRDRLINVAGRRVRTLAEVDELLASPPSPRPYVEVVRRDRIVSVRPPVPIFDLGERSSPRWVARVAAAILHPDGPGHLGVHLESVRGGLKITAVVAGSAAERAGLVQGNVLTSIDGFAIRDPRECRDRVRSYRAGSKVKLAMLRNGNRETMEVTLGPSGGFDLDADRFRIHFGQLNVEQGMRYAHATLPGSVVSLLTLGRGNEAVKQWLDAAIRKPSPMHEMVKYQLHEARAAVLAELGRGNEALADLDRAVELVKPMSSDSLLRKKARLLHKLKRTDEAVAVFRSLAGMEDNYLKHWDLMEIGRVLAEAGRIEEAKKAYRDLLSHERIGEAAAKALAALE